MSACNDDIFDIFDCYGDESTFDFENLFTEYPNDGNGDYDNKEGSLGRLIYACATFAEVKLR